MRPAAAPTTRNPAHRSAKRRDDRPRTRNTTTTSTTITKRHTPHSHGDGPLSFTPARDGDLAGQEVLAKNDKMAERVRGWLAGRDIVALNLVSSPGAGKTTLLERTIRDLGGEIPHLGHRGRSADAQTTPSASGPRDAGSYRSTRGRAATSTPPWWPVLCSSWTRPATRS